MLRETDRHFKFDWITIILFFILVGFGWLNILSASHTGETLDYFNFQDPYSKQLIFILLSIVLIIVTLSIDSKFYERFSGIIYIVSLLSLAGVFIFGKTINGSTSWYNLGIMTFQPSEFAKAATGLAVAKYISDLHTDIKYFKDQIKVFAIIAVPAILILLQNDTGSTLVYASFFFVLYREGLPTVYLIIALLVIVIGMFTLKFGITITAIIVVLSVIAHYFTRRKKPSLFKPLFIIVVSILFSFVVRYAYNNVIPFHQKDRISIWLRLEKDPAELRKMRQTVAYNLNESEKAISSGGFSGKGFLEGTRTTGKFVPEQHTDYIFSTVDEMKVFFHQTLVAMSNTFQRATQDEKMTATMKDFCDYFAEKLELNNKN